MFCKNCGKQVKDGAAFCTNCGTKIMPVGQSQPVKVEPLITQPIQPAQPMQPTQSAQPPVSIQMTEEQSDRGSKSLIVPIIIVAFCILIVIGCIFFVLRLNNKSDDDLIVEDVIKDVEVDQSDRNEDFSFEITEQNVEIDLTEPDISQPENIVSVEVEPEVSQYVLPNSDSTYLTESDLYGLTQEECRLARNELYARHGRKFDDEGLQAYFNSKDWYYGYINPSDFTESMLNDYEIANRDLIVQYEKEMGYR